MQTPVVQLRRLGAGVVLKLETRSPNGTWYDRLAPRLLALDLGEELREAGDGPLALALATQAQLEQRALDVWLPEDVPVDVVQGLERLGVKPERTPFAEGPEGARRRAREKGPLVSDSFDAFALRVEVMREILGELLEQAAPDAVVLGFDTGASAMAAVDVGVKQAVLVQPERAPVLSGGPWRPHRLHGLASGWPVRIDAQRFEVESVSDEEAHALRARLGREEGLLVSYANAACVAAALRVSARLGPKAKVAAIANESGERYFPIEARFEKAEAAR